MNYKKIYAQLIKRAKKGNRVRGERYYEGHHIRPKSLGGVDDDCNIVLLIPEEHFLAHYLLFKMHKESDWRYEPMLRAFMMMKPTSNSHEYRYIDAKKFGEGRRAWSKFMTENNPNNNPATREKKSIIQSNKRVMNNGARTTYVNKEEVPSFLSKGWKPGYHKELENRKGKRNAMHKSNREMAWVTDDKIEKHIRKGDLEFYIKKGFKPGRLPSEKGSKSKTGWLNPGAKFYKIFDAKGEFVEILIKAEIVKKYPKSLSKPGVPIFTSKKSLTYNKEIHKKFRGYWSEEVPRQEAEGWKRNQEVTL